MKSCRFALRQIPLRNRHSTMGIPSNFMHCYWIKLLIKHYSMERNTILCQLTDWGRVTHICVGKLAIIGWDDGLASPGRRQAIIWTNAGILSIEPRGTSFSGILFKNHTFLFKKMHLNRSSKRRPFCLAPNVLIHILSKFKRYLRLFHLLAVYDTRSGRP